MKKIHVLNPTEVSNLYQEEIEKKIKDLFRNEIYLPIVRELGFDAKLVHNSSDSYLIDAIKSGRLVFYRGVFTGRLNSRTTKELRKLGAVWDKRQGRFKIHGSKLPMDLRQVIAASEDRFNRSLQNIDKILSEMLPEQVAEALSVKKIFEHQIKSIDKDIEKNLKSISIQPKFTKEEQAKIAEQYTNNLKLSVQDFTSKEIVEMRKIVQKSTIQGIRYDSLAKKIQKRYDVSENKAKFLARQETKLLVSEMEKNRYQKFGSDGYFWDCVVGSPKHPVRPMHKALDKKFIRWDNPPIVNEKGEHKHAGEDWGCRCKKRPAVRF